MVFSVHLYLSADPLLPPFDVTYCGSGLRAEDSPPPPPLYKYRVDESSPTDIVPHFNTSLVRGRLPKWS